MTDYKNELEKALEKLKFTVLNRKVTEKDWESEIFFEVTSEFKATIEALLSKRELELLRHITVGGRGGMELFVQNVPIKSYKQQVSDRIKLTNREEK